VSRTRDLVEVVAKALADERDSVAVKEEERRDSTRVEVSVGPGELGKLIGRQGRTAAAVRTLASATAELEGRLAIVDFLDGRE
jgi:predicted RNA-binding protein YlqC (UPF0109 family)